MDRPRPRLALATLVALSLLLAGCSATDAPTTTTTTDSTPFTVALEGDGSTTYRVEARLVAAPLERVTVTYANGSNRSLALPDGTVSYGAGTDVTAVVPEGEVLATLSSESPPGFTMTKPDAGPAPNALYAVRRAGEDRLLRWGVVRCSGRVSRVTLVVGDDGLSARATCES
jgi:hypothetical protein